ncbi:MAG TPA: alkaline phosphatase D family protein [Pirellulaceae bacterium]|nr:alkaline phosphatase D family protein [Pirellulaceae bacterium]
MLAAQEAPAAIKRDGARPATAQGVSSGDVGHDRAILWSRCDRPARMFVEWATSERFADSQRVAGPAVIDAADFTGKIDLRVLPAGQRIFYRVQFQDLGDLKTWSEPAAGTFVTPSRPDGPPRDVKVAFTGDVCGQGWGIDPARGGLKMFETMRAVEPDLFIHLGDTIYADNPIPAELSLDDGTLWRNITTEQKAHVAQTLDDFRGAYRYNLLDENVQRFNSAVSQLVLWDDHETHNNWFPQGRYEDPRYQEQSSALLSARARVAFLEYQPIRQFARDRERIYRSQRFGPLLEIFAWDMRSYRGANSPNRQTELNADSAILGGTQLAWLKSRLAASTATWKVIASDMPLGVIVTDKHGSEAVANGDNGPPLGRELEIADLLKFIKDKAIRNVVFITADVHYAAAHYSDPTAAKFTEFAPFWEFIAGPAHAGTFGPGQLDATFGPQLKFLSIPENMKANRPPSEGLQFFGTLQLAAASKVLTAKLHNIAGQELFSVDLPPLP